MNVFRMNEFEFTWTEPPRLRNQSSCYQKLLRTIPRNRPTCSSYGMAPLCRRRFQPARNSRNNQRHLQRDWVIHAMNTAHGAWRFFSTHPRPPVFVPEPTGLSSNERLLRVNLPRKRSVVNAARIEGRPSRQWSTALMEFENQAVGTAPRK